MGVIKVKYDHKLIQSDIYVPLMGPDTSENPETTNKTKISQTEVQGFLTPVISISGISYEWNQVTKLILYNDSRVPHIDLVIEDYKQIISTVNNQINDNEVRLVIIPPYDNTYKKIDLTFYIDTLNIKGPKIHISATYKVPALFESRLKSFGKISTYELFDKIATECNLGFATNCEKSNLDKRYIYCDNITYLDLMNREIETSGDKNQIFDYWIDIWNNINLVDITARYKDVDSDEDMEVWVYSRTGNELDGEYKPDVIKMRSVISNNPNIFGELSTRQYKIINNLGTNQTNGTDKVYTIYKDGDIIDMLIEDGNPQNDIFKKYYYLGENIGDYEYLTSQSCRKSFLDIVDKNNIEVVLNYPCLGLMRGAHTFFEWWDNSFYEKINIEINGGDIADDDTGDQSEELDDEFKLIVNKQLSGEYLIYKTVLKYSNFKWNNILTLTKPTNNIKSYTNRTDDYVN